MMRRIALACAVLALLVQMTSWAATQDGRLRIVETSPTGAIRDLADAEEIRITFSEPMVAVGGAGIGGAPPWLSLSPAIPSACYWSGTRTLIIAPDAGVPLHRSTLYRVSVDASARSISGRTLQIAQSFSFVTPTPRAMLSGWYRSTGRFDSPVVFALRFNQPVTAADVNDRIRVRYAPHGWKAPVLQPEVRSRLERDAPDDLRHYDDKVAAASAAASMTSPVDVRLAAVWDEHRWPRSDETVVFETTGVPLSGAELAIDIDRGLSGAEGVEAAGPQSARLTLEPVLLVTGLVCERCQSGGYQDIAVRGSIDDEALARALSVTDLTDPAHEKPVGPSRAATGVLAGISRMGRFGYFQPPAARWLFRLDASLQARDGQTLGYSWMGIAETRHAMPDLSMDGGVWESSGGPRVPIVMRNVTALSKRMQAVTLQDLPQTLLRDARFQGRALPEGPDERQLLQLMPDVRTMHALDLTPALSDRGTGIAWTDLRGIDVLPGSTEGGSAFVPQAHGFIQVTNLGITAKNSARGTLVLVTRLDNAQPVGAARVRIVSGRTSVVWQGTTDAEGIAMAPPMRLGDEPIRRPTFVITAEKDGDVAYVDESWSSSEASRRWNADDYARPPDRQLTGLLFTDRGAYRVGDDVHYKLIARLETSGGLEVLDRGTPIQVQIRDPKWGILSRDTLSLGDWSSADSIWHVPEGASTGTYRITASWPAGNAAPGTYQSSVSTAFLVAAYRRPDFQVAAALAADTLVTGTPARATLDATYLLGAPVADRQVTWSVSREAVQSVPAAIVDRYPGVAFGVSPDDTLPALEWLASGTDRLDSRGHLGVDVPTSSAKGQAYRYQFEGEVEGADGRKIANRASLVMHPAGLYVGVAAGGAFLTAGEPRTLRIVAADLSGRARTGADVEVSLIHEVWLDTHGALTCGTCRVDRWSGWGIREDTVRDWHVTTGVDADAVSLTVSEGGSYIVRAAATDSDGRRTRTDVRLYVSGAGAGVWRNDDHAITLVPERRTWRPGETARILIQSPWAEAVALVTTEREAVRSVRHVRITSTSDVLSVPITEADVPNVFVSVVLLKGRTDADPASDEDVGAPAYRIGIVELDVATSVKRLQVAIDGGARTYRPRQTANVSVSVASPAGSPERSEVTLWAVDEGLLSLTDFHVPDPVAALYRPRSLNVSTVESRQRLIRRHAMIDDASGRPTHFVAESVDVRADVAILQAASGERSDVVGGQSTELEVRRDFRSVAWWLGSLVTGADGRAETSVTLPDGLTTYRIMAVAADRESRLGAASDRVTVTKPVTITPAFPRFLAEGDRATFDAVVTDVAGPAGRALIAVRSLTPEILSFDRATEAITLAKASAEPVRFDAFARGVGTARVQMTVTLGTETDAFETTIPVVSWRVRETEAAYGQTSGRAIERMAVPAGASTTTGGLTVSLASTALLGLGEGARYVNEYPYDCAEQHASRALVLAFVAALGPRFAGTGIASSQSRKLAEATAMSLSNYQCPNGGFSLWPGRCGSDGHLTAYILDVVRTISALGLKTPDVSRAASYLAGEVRPALPADPYWAAVQTTSRAYMLKVLAESGDQDRGALNRLLDERDHLPVTALSYAADALAAAGDRREAYADVIRRIRNAVRIDGDRAHAEEPDDPMLAWLWESEAQATAVVLDGFLRRGDEAPMVLPLVRGLLERRTNGRWATTHENAAAIRALGAYFRRAEERPARMTATVSVGPTAAGSATLDSSQHTARDVSIPWAALLGALDGAGRADIAIRREGTGPLYYTLRLDADRPQPREPLDRGLQILRTYEPASDATVRPVSFRKGDLVRVHLTLVLHAERRYVALVDPLPAGFEIVDGLLDTTRRRDAAAATTTDVNRDWLAWWRRGGFERIEKHDDRVLAFATRLSAGRHELSYLVRASASGTFQAPGARAEEMYAPEISGRGASSTVVIER